MEYLLLSQSQKYPLPQQTSLPPGPPPPPTASNSSRNIISPALFFIIVILAAIFCVSGLLHLLIRFLIKKTTSRSRGRRGTQDFSGSDALQRQLQQLFYLHDSGLDQASIDALPVFPYGEIVGVGGGSGSEDPFDCAVCLCEFLREDRLRLLPLCGHAFHLCCIDTWLLSNSTCPLCRGALLVQGVAAENPVFNDEEEESILEEEGALGREVEVPVRLGKFRRSTGNGINEEGNSIDESSSSSNLDTRRCYSMGSYQYIVGDANLRVALSAGDRSGRRGRGKESSRNLDVTVGLEKVEEEEEEEGKRLGAARKGESFSVSKIWLWGNKKGKLPDSSVSSGDSL